jgi:hypothetical protein
MVSGTRHSQADGAARNEFGQVRTPSIDKKNDLSFARPWGFVYTATGSHPDLNATGTIPAFRAYSLFLMRKTPVF